MNRIDNRMGSYADYIDLLGRVPHLNSPVVATFVNPFSYYKLADDSELLDHIDYFFSDGLMLCFIHNLFHKKKISRTSFDYSSVAEVSLCSFRDNGCSVAIIGATKNEIQVSCERIVERIPDLKIGFFRDGYLNDDRCIDEVLRFISASAIDVVVVGMGAPMQERFAMLIKKRCLNVKLVVTCGGFLTQTAIRSDYYHSWVKRTGLRWLQRAFKHRHVRQRLVREYPLFIVRYFYDHFLRYSK